MIVGLVGFIGSGKGTAGEILVEQGFTKVSFAGKLKDVASIMFGWERHLLEGETEESRIFREQPDKFWSKKFGREFTPREALQKLGTEAGRNVFHPNIWVDLLEKSMDPNKHYVISDVRFGNEIQWIRSMGGHLIEVRRGIRPHWFDIAAKANVSNIISEHMKALNFMHTQSGVHESEWKWIGYPVDATIDNDGTVAQLGEKLNQCLTKFNWQNTMNAVDEYYAQNGVNK